MSTYANLPAPSPEQGLNRYLQEIRKFPMLEPEEEYMLAKRWVDHEDTEAAHKMVTSHLRLAAKIAMGYRGYGLPQAEVISEANVGLMQAVKRFDPEKGFRLATYAMWWIRASIQEYILRSWSLVKLGTTSAQKKLFFNLRKAKARIGALEEGDLHPDNVAQIAHDLGVTETEVVSMNRRLSGGDASLNAMVGGSDGDSATQWQDWLEDEDADQAVAYAEKDELDARRELLAEAMSVLNDREKDILGQRRLSEETITLEDLSAQYAERHTKPFLRCGCLDLLAASRVLTSPDGDGLARQMLGGQQRAYAQIDGLIGVSRFVQRIEYVCDPDLVPALLQHQHRILILVLCHGPSPHFQRYRKMPFSSDRLPEHPSPVADFTARQGKASDGVRRVCPEYPLPPDLRQGCSLRGGPRQGRRGNRAGRWPVRQHSCTCP